jgi:hypothetical protein
MPKKQPIQTIDTARLEAIKQQIAYKIWEEEGRPEGRSDAHWQSACDIVEAMIANGAETPDWLQRVEQPAEGIAQPGTGNEAAQSARPEPPPRFQDVARRFAKGT